MVQNSTVVTVASTFKSRLKWLLEEKFEYLCNQNEVASKIKHAFTIDLHFTYYGIKSQLSWKKKKKNWDEAEVVQCPFYCYDDSNA